MQADALQPARASLVKTGTLNYPLTAQELREELRIPHGDQDALLTRKIVAATLLTEQLTSRSFVNTTFVLTLDRFPNGDIILPRSPLVSVTSIAYTDENGDTQTLATSVYIADTAALPGRIRLAHNQNWPSTRDAPRAVDVTFVAGEGATAADVSELSKNTISMGAAELYQQPEAVAAGQQHHSKAYLMMIGMLEIPRLA